MPEILIQLNINVPAKHVFNAFVTVDGLNAWWTKDSTARPSKGEIFDFHFGTECHWQGRVTEYRRNEIIEWEMTKASPDWMGSKVGAVLKEHDEYTIVDFYHKGWAYSNEHFRISSYCWAMYLRCMKEWLEKGVFIEYENRLS
jgi:uncharacterized protein YndB with AHSA1/START domain